MTAQFSIKQAARIAHLILTAGSPDIDRVAMRAHLAAVGVGARN